MAIDFNQTGEQTVNEYHPIPPKSKVMVRLEIIYPTQQSQGHQLELTVSKKSSLEYLATVLNVMSPSFEGKKIFANFNLDGAQTAGEKKAIDISMRYIRAIVEAMRGISPHDTSPQASQGRIINSWSDINGACFFVEVGCEKSKPNNEGKIYINNNIKRIITVDDPEYEELYQAQEKISDLPVPEISETHQQTWAAQTAQSATPAWAQKPAATPPAQSATPAWAQKPTTQPPAQTPPVQTPPAQSATPAWAQKPAATPQVQTPPAQTPPPPPLATPQGKGIDNVPF